jgi:hypothetical protein
MSRANGVTTCRGPDGLWRHFRVAELVDILARMNDTNDTGDKSSRKKCKEANYPVDGSM